jgi:hypothetical protein
VSRLRAHPFVQGRKADPQIIRNLALRKPAGQRYPHRFFAKFIRPACAHGSSPLPHNMCSEERHKTATGPIRARGARLLFLPPYSPDLNPIEQVFAKLKHLLQKAAERSVEATWNRIGSLLDAFPPHECANYFRNSGYGSN